MGTTTGTVSCRYTRFAADSYWPRTFARRTSMRHGTRGRYCRGWSSVFAKRGRGCASCCGGTRRSAGTGCSIGASAIGWGMSWGWPAMRCSNARSRWRARGRTCLRGDREEVPGVHRSAVQRGHLAPAPAGHRPYRARSQGAEPALHRDQSRRSGEGPLRAGVLPARRDGEPHQGAAARPVCRPHLEPPVVDESISGDARGARLHPARDDAPHGASRHGPCPSAVPNPATTAFEARRGGDPKHPHRGREAVSNPGPEYVPRNAALRPSDQNSPFMQYSG